MEMQALVIDDDVCCLDILVEYLTDKGFNVKSSLSPTCPMMEQNVDSCPMDVPNYDIVLSDHHIPGMSGLEFFEYQKQRGCKIPPSHKALISGAISNKDQKIAESMGCKIFHKPTSLDLIDSWIDGVLAQGS